MDPKVLKEIDFRIEGTVQILFKPTRDYSPTFLFLLAELKEKMLMLKGIENVIIRVTGVPDSERWNQALAYHPE